MNNVQIKTAHQHIVNIAEMQAAAQKRHEDLLSKIEALSDGISLDTASSVSIVYFLQQI
jgi:hypothetical protein